MGVCHHVKASEGARESDSMENLRDLFHPITWEWFTSKFDAPTAPQESGWKAIATSEHTLVAAPTGSGKTLTAFLVCIDRLLRQALEGKLTPEVHVVYVSPLKALSNDIRRNLEEPLTGILSLASQRGHTPQPIRAFVRSGDTPAKDRQSMLRHPPHILVTTPESLFILLTAERSRALLKNVQTVIVDEIHVLAADKRGSHLSLSLERLERLGEKPLQRIGLSATQRPIEEIARFLVGTANVDRSARGDIQEDGNDKGLSKSKGSGKDRRSGKGKCKTDCDGGGRRIAAAGLRTDSARCHIVDMGHAREIDLAIEVPSSELSAVCSLETWDEIYAQLAALISSHRSTLVFVNTRRLAERVTHYLSALLGEESVTSHHGSLSRSIRLDAEERLKTGQLKAIVATASLELGIDVGYIDLVCQVGSPRAIATCLQRVGRAGHSLGKTPKGRLFPLTRDELLECLALIRAARKGILDAIDIPKAPLDILAQQITAAACDESWGEDELFEFCRLAWPFRDLRRTDFDAVLEMLSDGKRGARRFARHLHRDRINKTVRARRGARIASVTSGGAIPENADFRVETEGDGTYVGTLNEDFALESMAGDIFLLGNTSWQIRHVRSGVVTVADARGAPATIPFWLGEAPGRTFELSAAVSRLREDLEGWLLAPGDGDAAKDEESTLGVRRRLQRECGASEAAARQVVDYIDLQCRALGRVPTQTHVIFERFFDESGGMQLVIHSPFGARVNRAWGLALRKRFCRSFNFELQAAANDNGIILSFGPQHSFPIDTLFRMVHPDNLENLLTQAVLAVPMFLTRWRWNATRALAVLRMRGGKKVPPPLQRFRADDFLTAVFPAQTGCLENHSGDVEIPSHPLVGQTLADCFTEAMDFERCRQVLEDIAAETVELRGVDTREPSPFSHELLNANPYAFLDDAPLEERRARAVATRRFADPKTVDELGQLDADAIDQVRGEAWPIVRDADELHEALVLLYTLPAREGEAWLEWFQELVEANRAALAIDPRGESYLVAAECCPSVQAARPELKFSPEIVLPDFLDTKTLDAEEAQLAIVRARLESTGPTTAKELSEKLGLETQAVERSLLKLESEGAVLRGRFTPGFAAPLGASLGSDDVFACEWCDRRLLQRIHRLTLEGLRAQVEPASREVFWQFLFEHQHAMGGQRLLGSTGTALALQQLQGFPLAAAAWETEVLPLRVEEYDTSWLDDLMLSGAVVWGRPVTRRTVRVDAEGRAGRSSPMTRLVPIALMQRSELGWLLPPLEEGRDADLGSEAAAVYDALKQHGALFEQVLEQVTGLLRSQVERALAELTLRGLVSSDGFASVRQLSIPSAQRRRSRERPRRALGAAAELPTGGVHLRGGRWSLFPGLLPEITEGDRAARWAHQLLLRYGVICRDLLEREYAAPRWESIARVLRRAEARGEVRGGRFVAGLGGEQYATPAALERLRLLRDQHTAGDSENGWIVISAVDPLNLTGILDDNSRVPSVAGNTIVLAGGRLLASRVGGKVHFVEREVPAMVQTKLQQALELGPQYRAYERRTRAATDTPAPPEKK